MCWKPERVITFPKDYSGQTVVKDLEEVIFQFPAPQRVDLVDPPPLGSGAQPWPNRITGGGTTCQEPGC